MEDARDVRLRRRLATVHDTDFSDDYTTSHEPVWKSHLAEFFDRPNIHLLEVGVFQGRSTLWFLQNVATHATSRITCVDSFSRSGGETRFDHNMKVSGVADRVVKIRGLSADVLPELTGQSFEVIYVDGSHQAADVLMDAVLCWALLKPRGVMIFDDYLWEMHRPASRRPKMAIDLFLSIVGDQARMLHKDYQVVIARDS